MSRPRVFPLALRPDGSSTLGPSPIYTLGCLMAYARRHDGGSLNAAFDLRPVMAAPRSEALQALTTLSPEPAVVLFSSYVWNYRVNLEMAAGFKQCAPDSLIVMGGPQIPRRREEVIRFLEAHPFVDVVARGEGELTLAELLSALAAAGDADRLAAIRREAVAGLSFRDGSGGLCQTPERERTRALEIFPSPYLTGEFESLIDQMDYAPIETNRGCPYSCTFCDWGAYTQQKIYQMPDSRVFGEIEYLARNHVRKLTICDANFGIFPRDVEITRHIVRMKQMHGFPEDVSYAPTKSEKNHLRETVMLLSDAGLTRAGQIALQTTDPNVLDITKRKNLGREQYEGLIRFFHQQDIPASSDMMVGLPGQTHETIKTDLQFFFDRMVTVGIHATSVMPNAPMADPEYMKRYQIVVDAEDFVESTFSFTAAEYQRMFALCCAYKFFVRLGVARYLLYFLQREHGVRALDFIVAWRASSNPRYPISLLVKQRLLDRQFPNLRRHWLSVGWTDPDAAFLFDDLEPFLRELLSFYAQELGVTPVGSDLEAVLSAQRAVVPCKAQEFPARVALPHDFVAYYRALRREGLEQPFEQVPPLREYGPGFLELEAQPRRQSYNYADFDVVVGHFECRSNLSNETPPIALRSS